MPDDYLVSAKTKGRIERLLDARDPDTGGFGSVIARKPSARYIFFTLPAALATTDASKSSCTVNGYWDGPNPGSSVTIYNLPASTNYIFSGASGHKGVAVYDEINSKYWIIQMECP
jgi:hypothetical protein